MQARQVTKTRHVFVIQDMRDAVHLSPLARSPLLVLFVTPVLRATTTLVVC
jgi:hypothetical protein